MSVKAKAAALLLLLTPFDSSLLRNDSCLASCFFGNVKDGQTVLSVLQPDPTCLASWTSNTSTLAPSASITQDIQQLVWLEESAVEESLKSRVPSAERGLDGFLHRLSTNQHENQAQAVMNVLHSSLGYEILYRKASAALISVDRDKARVLDLLLPPFWKSTLLPTAPIPFYPVSPSSLKPVEEILSKLEFNSTIASVVDHISVSRMRSDARFLTGEDADSGIISRHSFSPGALTAASWLKVQFEGTGASCTLNPFLVGFAPNVICRYASVKNSTSTVLFSAHYDSRGSFGHTRAPGGNDDGSGTMAILSIARAIKRQKIRFHSNVELVAFAGEEQGLLGSKAYARELRAANANIILMVQADMLAFHAPGEPPQLGLPDRIGSPLATQLVANVSALYSPELHVGFTPACCSDHQSFHEQGYPATQVFERAGPIADPMYHNSGDLSERTGYDFEQVKSIAKVQLATLLHVAGFEFSE